MAAADAGSRVQLPWATRALEVAYSTSVLVAAAGNDPTAGPRYPAYYSWVIGVGATDVQWDDDTSSYEEVIASTIDKGDFDDPTVLTFDNYHGFVGGPEYPDPWLSQGVRIWGFCSSSEYIFVCPYDNNAVIMEFVDPVQRVGADVLYSTTTTTRLEVYDVDGVPIEHVDGVGPTFLGLDVGDPIIAAAKFIDWPDAWSTFPNIDNLHYEVPEPATMTLLALGALGLFPRRRRRVLGWQWNP